MQNVSLASVDAVARPLLAIGTDYAPGVVLATHTHRRAQMLYGVSGLMQVETDDGTWVIPPYAGVWIPAGQRHRVQMQGVSTRSLYIEPEAAPRSGTRCEALLVTPLLHELLLAAVALPAHYDEAGRDGALVQLLLHEVGQAPRMPLFAPIPQDRMLAGLCQAFLAAPTLRSTPQQWAQHMHKSLRAFTRLFRQQTGMSFGAWRQQACLLAALPQLAAGQSVTQVALGLGYDSPSAFATMFRQRLGQAPSVFMQARQRAAPASR